MRVFVVSQEGTPLMPTTPRRARLWLKAKRARVVRREPFTIQLRFQTSHYTQQVTVGVDTGSKTVGLAALANGEVLFQAEAQLRSDISAKLTQRRSYRRARRSRKTRYRPARFANRRRRAGWLPPSVSSKLAATLKAVQFVATLLPVRQINVELASFDTQKMRHPEISGVTYQQGNLLGYQLREYLLAKWQRACVYCGATEIALQVEHIIPKVRGGSDSVTNLTLACEPCNQRKGNTTAAEFGYPHIQAQACVPLRDAAHVSALKTALLASFQQQFGEQHVQVRYGYQTTYHRIQMLGLPKSHAHDAVAIACHRGEVVMPLPVCWHLRCLPRGSYQRFNGKRSEHKCWAPRRVKGWKLYELVQAKGYTGYIAGRREKGSFLIKDDVSGKTLIEVAPSKLTRIARLHRGWMITQKAIFDEVRKESGASSSR